MLAALVASVAVGAAGLALWVHIPAAMVAAGVVGAAAALLIDTGAS